MLSNALFDGSVKKSPSPSMELSPEVMFAQRVHLVEGTSISFSSQGPDLRVSSSPWSMRSCCMLTDAVLVHVTGDAGDDLGQAQSWSLPVEIQRGAGAATKPYLGNAFCRMSPNLQYNQSHHEDIACSVVLLLLVTIVDHARFQASAMKSFRAPSMLRRLHSSTPASRRFVRTPSYGDHPP